MRFLLLLLACCLLQAADLPDPSRDLNGRSLIANLATLRAEVAARPQDAAVWAAITRTYALLALHTEPDMWGAYGPWWDYAHRARTVLEGLRAGPPTSEEEALPGLWVDLLDKRMLVVVETLDRLAPASTSPEVKALRAMAQGRPELAAGPGPLLTFARASAVMMSGQNRDFGPTNDRGQDPWSMGVLSLRTDENFNREAVLRAIVADTAWMLQGTELDEAQARPLLTALLAAVNAPVAQDATKMAMIQSFQTTVKRIEIEQVGKPLFIASWRACQACLTGKPGWAGTFAQGLIGLGDVARWNRDRHYLWLLYLVDWNNFDELESTLIRPIEAELGLILPVGRAHLNNMRGAAALMTALRNDLALPVAQRMPPPVHAVALVRIAEQDANLANELAEAVFAEFAPLDNRAFEALSEGCRLAGRGDLVVERVAAMSHSAPWNWAAAKEQALIDPTVPMLHLPAQPTRVWHDEGVDLTAPQAAHAMPAFMFAVRWTGTITLPESGVWQIAVDSDDGSQLVIGTRRLDNGGDHAMQRRVMTLKGPATDLPLRLEFYNRGGGLGCQLRWKGPHDTDFTLIPAAHLRANGQPGLRAELHELHDERTLNAALQSPEPVAESFLARVPWHAHSWLELAEQRRVNQNWAGAEQAYAKAAALRSIEGDASLSGSRLMCMLKQDPADVMAAAAILKHLGWWWLSENDMDTLLHHCVATPSLAHGLAPLLADLPARRGQGQDPCANTSLVRLQVALAAGDLAQALKAAHTVAAQRDQINARCTWRKEAIILEVLLARLFEPDWRPATPLNAQVTFDEDTPMFSRLAEWLSGDASWQEVEEGTPENLRQNDLPFLHALAMMSHGDHVSAKAELGWCANNLDRLNTYRSFAQEMLAWYDQQTPATLAAITRAKPLKMGSGPARVVPTTEGGANSF